MKVRFLREMICAALFVAMGLTSGWGQERKPDLVLKGTIAEKDRETYVEVPFRVPAGVVRVSVDFHYTGHEKQTTIDLGLLDTEGFRGWSGGNKSAFTVSESDATPSYLPGPDKARGMEVAAWRTKRWSWRAERV